MRFFMPEQQESAEDLAQIRFALEDLSKTGQISEDVYFKSIVILASRYACRGDMDTARSLALIPTDTYYRLVLSVQMGEDHDYEKTAVDLASAFVEADIVDPDVDVPITQWMADA